MYTVVCATYRYLALSHLSIRHLWQRLALGRANDAYFLASKIGLGFRPATSVYSGSFEVGNSLVIDVRQIWLRQAPNTCYYVLCLVNRFDC